MRVRTGRGPVRRPLAAAVVLAAAACAVRPAGRPYPDLAKYAGREIQRVDFQNTGVYSPDTLRQIVQTQPTRCSFLGLPLCVPFTTFGQQRHALDPVAVVADVQRLRLFYRIGGFYGTGVTPEVKPAPRDPDDVRVTFRIAPGDSVVLDSLRLTGLDTVLDPVTVARSLPSRAGERFNLAAFAASADSLNGMLQAKGHAFSRVLRDYAVDTVTDRATAELQAIPGPLVRIDTILVVGATHLGRGVVLRQLTFRQGDVLRSSTLVQSQSNLYSLGIVQIATVSAAPDSLRHTPRDSSAAAVVVRIVEAPEHQVQAALGWGSVECFRTDGSWTDRSFGGGARQLEVNASLSKIGVGQGLGGSVCPAFRNDTLGNRLDYRLSATFTQPFLLSPRNHPTFTAYAERQSEPNVFQRTDRGGSFAVAHRLRAGEFLTASLNAEQGQTLASPVLFCTALLVCQSSDIAEATRYRWLNRLSLGYSLERTDDAVNPTNGYALRSALDWAAPWLLSSSHFTRWTGEVDHYNHLLPGVVLAAALRFGTLFRTGGLSPGHNFLPPEERFYAGGSNSVRGYDRNLLGPGVWWTDSVRVDTATGDTVPGRNPTFVPTGGTALGIANLELRTPAPFLRDRLRLAWFVDAGSVVNGELWTLGSWRFTPGIGVRLGTPVGPFRLDVAYNAYPPTSGPLFYATPTTLVRLRDSYRPPSPSFWGRLHFTLAVGQAF